MIFIKSDIGNGIIDMGHTMYPSRLTKVTGKEIFTVPEYATVFGVVLDGIVSFQGGYKQLKQNEYFCITSGDVAVDGSVVFFTRYGFNGQTSFGGPIEKTGRLSYIDNCSDSILVYPPRYGDASISLLSFPPGIDQRFHTHPSIRLGVILEGHGYSESSSGRVELTPGTAFCVPERDVHKFVTTEHNLNVISYHPDGDWGPTDENHTLLNRTYEKTFMVGK